VDLQEIRKIVELMNEHGLSYFHLEEEGVNLKLKKGVDSDAIREAMGGLSFGPAPTQLPAQPAPATPSAAEPAAAPVEVGEEITSPMVGTYYSKPSPDSPPFVEVGSTVSEGQTLCIIEAMKVMNEIHAEISGTITEALVENGESVEYGQPLFKVKTA
jgi:acetyl-CoA carboxylase biotin carboxyl carrier protein